MLTATQGTRLNFEGRTIRRNDGEVRWIEITGILRPGSDGSPRRILGTAADITDRKRAEEELRASEERYRTLFDSMDEGFCVIQLIFDESRQCRRLPVPGNEPGFRQAHRTGRGGRQTCDGAGAQTTTRIGSTRIRGLPQPAMGYAFEQYGSGLGRWFDIYATRLGGPGSDKVAILFNDITDRKRAEENLRRLASELAETDRRKTEFLATLAHELRNPLAPLTNGLQLMRMAADNPQAQERAREMMERQLRHLVRLVDDLLDIARISSGKVELKKERVDAARRARATPWRPACR